MPVKLSDGTIDLEFIRKIKDISGQNIYKCMQCGTCAGACPMRDFLDTSPTRILHLTHLGRRQDVSHSNTVWFCA